MTSKAEPVTLITEINSSNNTRNETPSSPALAAWPTRPKPLLLSHTEKVLRALYDIVLILMPVLLVVKTVLVIVAEHLDRFNTGISIDSASFLSRFLVGVNDQLVTLFTIVFVTIISTTVKRYALWRAQAGAYISDLEQLQGSTSLPSTLRLIWSLRSFGLTSVLLAFVWSFYYLGSQAVKLEYRLSDSAPLKWVDAAIQRPDVTSLFSSNISAVLATNDYSLADLETQSIDISNLNLRFASAIIDSVTNMNPHLGTSNYGPLIPNNTLASTANDQSSLMDKLHHRFGGWVDTSQQSRNSYMSLVGTPLWMAERYDGISSGDLVTVLGSYIVYDTGYLNISCGDALVLPYEAFPNGTIYNSSVSLNLTKTASQFTYSWRGSLDDYNATSLDPIAKDNATLTMACGYGADCFKSTMRTVQMTCNITMEYIDMEVNCLTSGCYPQRMRWRNNTDQVRATTARTPFDDEAFASALLSNFTLSTGPQLDLDSPTLLATNYFTNLTYYLQSGLGSAKCGNACLAAASYTIENLVYTPLSQQLTQGINTYYLLSQSVLTTNYILQPQMDLVVDHGTDGLFDHVRLHGAIYEQAYRVYWQWIPIDFVACLVLFAAAVWSFWLRVHTLAPDIFGYVSSLTRDNPNLQLPTEGSTLDGLDRARYLKGIKVKIGDLVGDSTEAGRVGLAPADRIQRLQKEKVYI